MRSALPCRVACGGLRHLSLGLYHGFLLSANAIVRLENFVVGWRGFKAIVPDSSYSRLAKNARACPERSRRDGAPDILDCGMEIKRAGRVGHPPGRSWPRMVALEGWRGKGIVWVPEQGRFRKPYSGAKAPFLMVFDWRA